MLKYVILWASFKPINERLGRLQFYIASEHAFKSEGQSSGSPYHSPWTYKNNICCKNSCLKKGEYRAPKSRNNLNFSMSL